MHRLLAFLLVFLGCTALRADLLDDFSALQDQLNEAILDACAGSPNESAGAELQAASEAFAKNIDNPDAKSMWTAGGTKSLPAGEAGAHFAGGALARMQHVLALEMVGQARAGNFAKAQEWRALIVLPKHASAVEGAPVFDIANVQVTGTGEIGMMQLNAQGAAPKAA